jgi:hypothetical protein
MVRTYMGHTHIPLRHAARINDFYWNYWNVYLHFHYPSGFAEIKSDAKGKLKKIYKSYFTIFEALTGHPAASKFLKIGRTLEKLAETAQQERDNACAAALQNAKDH